MGIAFMASISSPQDLKPSTSVAVSQVKSQPTYHCRHENDIVLVATERIDHTYHLGTCILPGDASEKMVGLKVWHKVNTGRWQAVGAYMLCKKSYIAVGTLGPPSDLETQMLHETQFENLIRNETLTRGYARPTSLVDSTDIFDRVLPSFRETPDGKGTSSRERHALVVALETDLRRVSLFILMTMVIGVAVSAGVAILENGIGLGAEIGGAVFGFAAVLQCMMIMMYK